MKNNREWWIGITEDGFSKWLVEKHPEQSICSYAFISDGTNISIEHCKETIAVIEKSAYDELLKQTIALSKAIWDADEYMYEHSIQGTGNLDNILRDAGFKWLGFCASKGIKDPND